MYRFRRSSSLRKIIDASVGSKGDPFTISLTTPKILYVPRSDPPGRQLSDSPIGFSSPRIFKADSLIMMPDKSLAISREKSLPCTNSHPIVLPYSCVTNMVLKLGSYFRSLQENPPFQPSVLVIA